MRFRIRRTNSKVLMILAILIFGIFIRVGYAYLSQDLSIIGLAVASKDAWGIHFVENSIVEDTTHLDTCSSGNECSRITQHATINQDGKSVSFGVIFHAIDEYYEFTVDVVNNGTIDAMLNEIVKEGLTGNSEYLDFTVTYSDGTPIAQYDQLLKNGGTETLKVTVTYIGTPIEDVNANLGLTVNYIQADDSVQSRSYEPETMIRSLNTLGTSIADDDPDGNLRFIGANPNNYISFNNQTWRIIGVFDGRLKIVYDSIGNYSFDSASLTTNSGNGINVWGQTTYKSDGSIYTGSDLMKLLNPGYETNTDLKCVGTISGNNCGSNSSSDYETDLVNNSLYWNASSGTCYTSTNYQTSSCDFSSTGLQTNSAKNMIENHTWNLGSNPASADPISMFAVTVQVTANYLYNIERSNNIGNGCDYDANYCTDGLNGITTWQGKVGLMYPSDYAYATAGGTTHSRSTCLGMHNANYSGRDTWKEYTDCRDNDWLFDSNSDSWSLTPRAGKTYSDSILTISKNGNISTGIAMKSFSVRPTVYLKKGVFFTNEGEGTQARPYVLRDLSNVHTVTFDANGGTLVPTTKQVDAESNIGTLPTPTAPTGKTFDGWYTEVSGGTKITSSYIPTNNVTVYAHWLQIYDPETRIRLLNTIGTSIADDDPDGNLRFIGANPNNYVSFNNQTWRIIGVFDGKLKIIQESIGKYPWDTSKKDTNSGWGVNQWGPNNSGYTGSDLMKLLNPGYETNEDFKCVENCNSNDSTYSTEIVNNSLYWNASSGSCYSGDNHITTSCDFTSTGLSDTKSKNMIENATWYLGTNVGGDNIWYDGQMTVSSLYAWERSNNSSKQCNSGNYCTDSIDRTLSWQGKVGLIYPSDYVYATGGGTTYNRATCLTYLVGDDYNFMSINNWQRTYADCRNNDWLGADSDMWTISPRANTGVASYVFEVSRTKGYVYNSLASSSDSVNPTVYLKSNVKFVGGGTGTQANPFNLKIIE